MDNGKTKNPINFYVMSDEQIQEICRVAGEAGATAGIKQYKESARRSKKEIADKRYHNTELLLEKYNTLKLSAENAVFDIQQVEEEQSVKQILDLMMGYNDSDLLIQSVKKSKVKTEMILKHIDAMLQVYKNLCQNTTDELEERRYNILIDRYIASPRLSAFQLSEKYYLSERTIYDDLRASKSTLATLIFGIDGVFESDAMTDADETT